MNPATAPAANTAQRPTVQAEFRGRPIPAHINATIMRGKKRCSNFQRQAIRISRNMSPPRKPTSAILPMPNRTKYATTSNPPATAAIARGLSEIIEGSSVLLESPLPGLGHTLPASTGGCVRDCSRTFVSLFRVVPQYCESPCSIAYGLAEEPPSRSTHLQPGPVRTLQRWSRLLAVRTPSLRLPPNPKCRCVSAAPERLPANSTRPSP